LSSLARAEEQKSKSTEVQKSGRAEVEKHDVGAGLHKSQVIIAPGGCERITEKNEHRTSNVQHRTLNGKK
jgi:hypothetical protein